MPYEPAGAGTIWGYVTDGETDDPIAGASVFVAHTLFGSASQDDGYFAIEGLEDGEYELVISRIGYESQRIAITIRADAAPQQVDIKMMPIVYELDDVSVTAEKNKTWAKQADLFNALFLGTMPFEEEAHIDNAYVLDFEEDRRVLSASSSEVLRIDNPALKFSIYFQLMGFQWEKRNKILHFTGAGYYIQHELEESERHIQRNRNGLYSWLARSSPSEEGNWKGRVLSARCGCQPFRYGIPNIATCQCSYTGLALPPDVTR